MAGGRLGGFNVTDAYEQRRGRLVIKVGRVLPIRKMTGPAFDKGELQRYLAYVIFCAPILVNNPSLQWEATGADRLRVRDRLGPGDATVDIEIDPEGRPVLCRAMRPRDNRTEAPWSATATDFEETGGVRVPRHMSAAWRLGDGEFTYITIEVVSFTFDR